MVRIAGVVAGALLAGTLSGCGSANLRSAPTARHMWTYTRAQVRTAFAAQGLPLSSRYLHVFVLKPHEAGRICTAAGGEHRPRPASRRGCSVFVWFPGAVLGRHPNVFDNALDRDGRGDTHGDVEALYVGGHGLDRRVKAAMASLPR